LTRRTAATAQQLLIGHVLVFVDRKIAVFGQNVGISLRGAFTPICLLAGGHLFSSILDRDPENPGGAA
jgi:hypothetical protein